MPGWQRELAADQIELGALRLLHSGRALPIGAGIAHGGIQHHAEEIIAQVIMPLSYSKTPRPRCGLHSRLRSR